jgi:hypothetical protein
MLRNIIVFTAILCLVLIGISTAQTASIEIRDKSNPEDFSAGELRFIVSLNTTLAYDAYYSFTTSDGTAKSGLNDYKAYTNQQVKIPAGATIRHAVVEIYDDEMYEPDETFTVTIHDAYIDDGQNTPLTITTNTATGTIVNDDGLPTIEIQDKSQVENFAVGLLRFPVELSAASYYDIYFEFETIDNTAKSPQDYAATSQVVMIKGDKNRIYGHAVIPMVDDLIEEYDETMYVQLLSAWIDDGSSTPITISDDMGKGTIIDNDAEYMVDLCSNIDSDRNVGLAPVLAKFNSIKEMAAQKWWMDLDVRSNWPMPDWIYWYVDPPTGKDDYGIRMAGPVSDHKFPNFIDVYEPGGLGHLVVKEASPAPKWGWDNAVDGDTYWWNGTAMVGKDETGKAWATFEFSDQGTRTINTLRLMTDTGIDKLGLQASAIKVFVSTDGETFTQVLEAEKTNNRSTPCEMNDDWMTWEIDPVEAKYIKLVICEPNHQTWVAVGEFEVWFDATLPDPDQCSLAMENGQATLMLKDAEGNPLTGLTDHDIKIYNFLVEPDYHGTTKAMMATNLMEGSEAGTYTADLAGWGEVKASVFGVVIEPDGAGAGGDGAAQELAEAQAVPTDFALLPNFPNPFNPETTIRYQLSESEHVILTIYDIQGREIATLVDESLQAGEYSVTWNAMDRPSGMYFYRIIAGEFQSVQRMTLLK